MDHCCYLSKFYWELFCFPFQLLINFWYLQTLICVIKHEFINPKTSFNIVILYWSTRTSQKSKRSRIYMLEISSLSLSALCFLSIGCRNCWCFPFYLSISITYLVTMELFTLCEPLSSLPVFGGVRVAPLFSFSVVLFCVLMFWVQCCDLRYDVRIKTMFGSYLPPGACRRAESFLRYLCLVAYRCILCCVFVYFLSSCVPFVSSFSGLSLFDCLCDIL